MTFVMFYAVQKLNTKFNSFNINKICSLVPWLYKLSRNDKN